MQPVALCLPCESGTQRPTVVLQLNIGGSGDGAGVGGGAVHAAAHLSQFANAPAVSSRTHCHVTASQVYDGLQLQSQPNTLQLPHPPAPHLQCLSGVGQCPQSQRDCARDCDSKDSTAKTTVDSRSIWSGEKLLLR